MRHKLFSVLVSIGIILLFGCYEIETVDQPTAASENSSFITNVVMALEEANFEKAVPNFGVKLPIGWTMLDTVPFIGDLNGFFVYNSVLTDSANVLWPPEQDYFWWVGNAVDTINALPEGSAIITPLIITGDHNGIFNIEYRVGSDKSIYNETGPNPPGFLYHRRQELILITPNSDDISGNVYVSTSGALGAAGTESDPLSTIFEAIARMSADSIHPGIIHLANGLYSPTTNGEYFPIGVTNYVSIIGESESGVILDADSMANVMSFINTNHSSISNLTITGGAGGIHCTLSNPTLLNLTITGNLGSGISCVNNSNPTLTNVTITDNIAYQGGGIYCENSDITFSAENRCNIFLNHKIRSNDGGADIYSTEFMDVIVDTFTVMSPTDHWASPIGNFAFDILNPRLVPVDADLYIRGGPQKLDNSLGVNSGLI